jgi:hypothetical protein
MEGLRMRDLTVLLSARRLIWNLCSEGDAFAALSRYDCDRVDTIDVFGSRRGIVMMTLRDALVNASHFYGMPMGKFMRIDV